MALNNCFITHHRKWYITFVHFFPFWRKYLVKFIALGSFVWRIKTFIIYFQMLSDSSSQDITNHQSTGGQNLHTTTNSAIQNCFVNKGSFRLVTWGCKSAADCGKDVYFLRQMVAFLHGDRKFPISALMQPTTDARGKRSNVNEPLLCTTADGYFCPVFSSPAKVHWLKLEPLTKRLKANHQSHSTSVTRWLDYFSIFGHLQWWKLAQKCHKFGKVSLVFCLKEMNGQKYA